MQCHSISISMMDFEILMSTMEGVQRNAPWMMLMFGTYQKPLSQHRQ